MRHLILKSIVFVFLFFQSVNAQEVQVQSWDNGIGHSSWDLALSDEERKTMPALWDAIGEDLKTEQNKFAGTYFKAGRGRYFLKWSVQKGFLLIPFYDENLITDFSYGKVTYVDSSEIGFSPEEDLEGGYGSFKKTPRKWTAIWKYLVPVELIKDFGMYQAGLGKYNLLHGNYYEASPGFLFIRIDGKEKDSSYPVPAKYERFIKKPISGQITFVGKKRFAKDGEVNGHWVGDAVLIPVRINIGSRNGVKRNMFFRPIGDESYWQYLEIKKVNQQTSEGYIVRELSSDGKETYKDFKTNQEKPLLPIRVGDRVTTSLIID